MNRFWVDCIIIGVQYALHGDLTVNMRLWGLCRLLSTFFFFFFGPARFVFCKRREQCFRLAPASKKDAPHSFLINLSWKQECTTTSVVVEYIYIYIYIFIFYIDGFEVKYKGITHWCDYVDLFYFIMKINKNY